MGVIARIINFGNFIVRCINIDSRYQLFRLAIWGIVSWMRPFTEKLFYGGILLYSTDQPNHKNQIALMMHN